MVHFPNFPTRLPNSFAGWTAVFRFGCTCCLLAAFLSGTAFSAESLPIISLGGGGNVTPGQTAHVDLNLNASLSSDLVVNVSFSGTALPTSWASTSMGTSDDGSCMTITIPAGVGSRDIEITPLPDQAIPETDIQITILPDASYEIGTATSAITIKDQASVTPVVSQVSVSDTRVPVGNYVRIEITGTDFDPSTMSGSVSGCDDVSVDANGQSSYAFTVRARDAGVQTVRFSKGSEGSNLIPGYTIEVFIPPFPYSLSPTVVSSVGGTTITASASEGDFQTLKTVKIDGSTVPFVIDATGASFTCAVPPHAAGSATVVCYDINDVQMGTTDNILSYVVPPSNDAVANAALIAGGIGASATGSNVLATNETGDPSELGQATVWYTWTAPDTRYCSLICVANFSWAGGVYRRAADGALVSVIDTVVGDGVSGNSGFAWHAENGVTYVIGIGGHNSDIYGGSNPSGSFTITLGAGELVAPANDLRRWAKDLGSSVSASDTVSNVRATNEDADPQECGYGTIWWKWTAPSDGKAAFSITATGIPVTGVIVKRDATGTDSVVGPTDAVGTKVISVRTGEVYLICAGGQDDEGQGGSITVSVRMNASPANDDFASSIAIQGADVRTTGTNVNATSETGEPESMGSKTVWWTWTAPRSATVQVDVGGSALDAAMSISTGNALASLTPVQDGQFTLQNISGSVLFSAVAGQTYVIQVSGYGDQQGDIVVAINTTFPDINRNGLREIVTLNGDAVLDIGTVVSPTGSTFQLIGAGNGGDDMSGLALDAATGHLTWNAPPASLGGKTIYLLIQVQPPNGGPVTTVRHMVLLKKKPTSITNNG